MNKTVQSFVICLSVLHLFSSNLKDLIQQKVVETDTHTLRTVIKIIQYSATGLETWQVKWG